MKIRLLLIALFLLTTALSSQVQERILSYHSDLRVFLSGSMQVTETICVRSNDERIRHGIFRTFPTRYRDYYGNRYYVPLSVKSAFRNGRSEKFAVKPENNGVKIYLGDAETVLAPGIYTYVLIYETDRQLGFFKDHDELYWNVTGNDWEFAMDSVSVTVELPAQAAAAFSGWNGFTGESGSTEKSVAFHRLDDGRFHFIATRPLSAREGLTILLTWPRDILQRPGRTQIAAHYIKDNAGVVVGLAGLLIVLLYFYLQWQRVGRDPQKGVIIPQFRPPDTMRPEAVRFIMRMGFDNKTFTAFLLNLAVQGQIAIREQDGVFFVRRDKSPSTISAEESAVLDALFGGDHEVELKNTNHVQINAAVEKLKKQLAASAYARYFQTNRKSFWPGVLLSVATISCSILAFSAPEAIFMIVWLSVWSLGVGVLVHTSVKLWRNALAASHVRYASMTSAIFMSLFSIPFIAGELFGLYALSLAASLAIMPIILAIVFTNYLFHHLLKAPTPPGRKAMDQIEGFRMYLTAAERERWNTLYPPDQTPQLYEKYLPYALALGVEQQWSEQFAKVLQDAQYAGHQLTWYQSNRASSLNFADFSSSFGSSFSSAISSSATAPGSSSGSSGGSSGGGGGGGGGGGW